MPGRKEQNTKNYSAHKQWVERKQAANAQRKQQWVWDIKPVAADINNDWEPGIGHWERIEA